MLRALRHTATLALLAGAAAPAAAQTIYYGQNNAGTANAAITQARSDFLSSLSGVGTESFESFADNVSAPITLNFPGAGAATLTGTGRTETGDQSGANSVSGSRYYFVETGAGAGVGSEFTISFANPIAAFGFFGRDLGDSGSNLFLRLTRAAGGTTDVQVPYNVSTQSLSSGNLLFFGMIDATNPFTSIEFRSTSGGDFFGFDDMTIGTAQQVNQGVVPEPSTYALMATGLGLLATVARRRRVQR